MQAGVFAPLASSGFQDYRNLAMQEVDPNAQFVLDPKLVRPCDPVKTPTKYCFPKDHGGKAGKPSMMRATLQLMADWKATEKISIHAVVRVVGSLKLDVDEYAQPSKLGVGVDRREYNRDWAWRNYYNEVDLREFYVDVEATRWLSFRIGRQQVTWGDIGSYRLLDVVNPTNSTWHFGPLESFEDTRIPLWILKTFIEIKDWDQSLEVVWVPAIDRDEDLVTTPLTFVGAWGLPLSNTPSPHLIHEKKMMYPGNVIEDQRIGFRWQGSITPAASYSLVYYYTHQLSPPIPLYFDLDPNSPTNDITTLYLGFPRQHIAGFTFDYAFENPIGMVAKFEMSIEPDHTYPRKSKGYRFMKPDDNIPNRYHFEPIEKPTVNYAVQLMRPTMIRWLNPTSNILFVGQFMHTMIPTLTRLERRELTTVPGFNDYELQKHSYTGVFVMATNYLHGLLSPRMTAAYVHPKSGFISGALSVRIGPHWRIRLQVTDFFGHDQYRGVGLFRDRDEINLRVRCQF